MKFARRARSDIELNVTPLIDVVFLLLIFFMVSTTFTKRTHLNIDLPTAADASSQKEKSHLEITISRQGDYAINGVSLVNRKLATLKNALEKVSKGDHARPLIITADADSTHQSVVTAMDAAGQLGFTQLSITTTNAKKDQ